MLARLLHWTAPAVMAALLVSCATPSGAQRPPDPAPPSASSEPVPPRSGKKGVILPADVKLGTEPGPSVGNPATAGPAVGPALGSPTSPN